MVTDPVCGVSLEVAETKASLLYGEDYYYFCSAGCMAEFQRHPDEYAKAVGAEEEGEARV